MKIILIMALIGAVLYAIDMLVCKISPKAGYMVAVFNLPFLPVGIVTFILTQKYLEKTLGVSDVTQYFRESGESAKQKKKKGKSSANISQKTAEVQANKRIELVIPEGTTEINDREFENREDIISVVIPKGVNRIRKQAFAGCKNLKKVSLPDDITISPDAFLYCNKLSDEVEQKIADKVEGMYRKSFVNSGFRYSTPNSDPNYDTTGEGLDTNKFIYETRRAQNGEFYTACFSRLGNPQGTHTGSRASSTKKTEATESQTSSETIVNTKKSESVNGKHGRLIFNDPYGKFSHQTSSIKSRANNANIEIEVQEKDRQPVALTIKVTECECYEKSETVSYFKANYSDLDSRDLPILVDEMKKLHFLDSYKGKNETYRALIENDIKTITKEQYESLGFDFKVNEKKREANEEQDNLSEQTSALIIPKGAKEIKDGAFSCAGINGRKLEFIDIPEGVERIGKYAFEGSSIKAAVIPSSVTLMDSHAFYLCRNLENVYISDLGKWCDISFETEANPLNYAKNLYLNDKLVDKCVIPEGTKEIKASIFEGYKGLKELVIPEGVTKIGNNAFRDCINLKSVVIPDSVKVIGEAAFAGCENLTYVNIPEGVTAIGNYAFSSCKKLTALAIPEGVTAIGIGAFSSCKKLTALTIPEGVTAIGSYAFSGCKNLTSVKIPEGVTAIESSAFSGCENLTSVKIPEGVTAIGSYAFSECVKLTDVKIPKSVTEIGAIAFSGCTNLKTIVIPDNVKTMGHSVFDGCINLKSVVISKSISEIKFQTFKLCENLSSIKIPKSVTTIDDGAFSGCVKLTDVKIPENVEYIGKEAFARCFNLKTVEFPKSDPEINPTAFLGCNCINEEIKVEIDRIVKKILPLEEMEDYIPPYDESVYKSVLLSRENESKMSYGNGILSIVDHRGRYMGMQDVAGGFLTGVCIDISTQGPDDNPTAVVITVYDKEDAGKNFEDIKFVTTMKADYEKTATQLGFKIFVEAAKNTYYMNRKYNKKGVYYYVCTGIERYRVTSETFNNPNLDFSWSHFKALQRTFYLLYLKKNPGASYDDFEKYVWDALPQDYETPRDDPKFDASIEPSHTVRKTEKRIAKNGECYWVKA